MPTRRPDSPNADLTPPERGHIRIRGARTHNLKNLDVDIPRGALVVMTGPSGSGKSSLAFDTLYAEGQRRYVESLSAYARQFLGQLDKPDVDLIDGLSPAIAIEQKSASHNPRSTVGTVTEVYDYLRLLYARAGVPRCPEHGTVLAAQTISQMVDALLRWPQGTRLALLAPVVVDRKGAFAEVFAQLQAMGYTRFRINGAMVEAADLAPLDAAARHTVEVVIDRLKVRADIATRLAESLETALRLEQQIGAGSGRVLALNMDTLELTTLSSRFACPHCSYTVADMQPRMFSFNSPQGACPSCDGLGVVESFDPHRVVAFPELSLAAGAIAGWDRRNATYHALLRAVAAHCGQSVDSPFESWPAAAREMVLWGSGDEAIAFEYAADGGKTQVLHHPFEGVIPNMERRWRDNPTDAVRSLLEPLRNSCPCRECGGTRLGTAARHVWLGDDGGGDEVSHASIETNPEAAQGLLSPTGQETVLGQSQALPPQTPDTSKATFCLGLPCALTLSELCALPLSDALRWFEQLHLKGARAEIAARVVAEIRARLRFLVDVGLGYLSLERSAHTLSGGELQRIRLASQIGSGLSGVMYVLDEPSIGLHQRDNDRLIATMRRLRELGNSVIVVEHDEDMIRAADQLIDIGPGAGEAGGSIVAQTTPAHMCAHPEKFPQSITAQYLSGTRRIERPACAKKLPAFDPENRAQPRLHIHNARGHNLRNASAILPVGRLTCVTGVSGSGKSTLINHTLLAVAQQQLHSASVSAAPHGGIDGMEHLDKVINVDQSPIGRTPRSNPATYTGVFTAIRDLFAQSETARERGWGAGRFSFNVPQSSGGGRCEACQGDGVMRVEMHFLPDVYVPCEVCGGQRYSRETLQATWRGANIAQVLEMTVAQARAHFAEQPAIARKLHTLEEVGLGYVRLGQSATTLSGGEAQRLKLALELAKRDTGRTLYVLDEPTTGLHFGDVQQLLTVLFALRDAGNTIVVIEHHLDLIAAADWVVDLGPEGGAGGGHVIAQGTPHQIAQIEASHTGRYLGRYFGNQKA